MNNSTGEAQPGERMQNTGTRSRRVCLPTRRAVLLAGAAITVAGPAGCSPTVHVETDEGTWMSVDISPDGETIVFDLVGHVYAVPAIGGRARQLTRGEAWHRAPRISPDGAHIAMVRDQDSGDEVWVMDGDGGGLRQITDHSAERYGQVRGTPAWSPDGAFILFGYDADGYSPRLFQVSLEDSLVRAVEGLSASSQSGVFLANGAAVLATEMHLNGGEAIQAGGPISVARIVALDLSNGVASTLRDISAFESDYCPQVSRDGRRLAYVHQESSGRISLRVRDLDQGPSLSPGTDREVAELPDDDDPFRFDSTDTRPAFAFSPDGESLLIGAGGKLRRIDIATGHSTIIPFVATIDRELAPRATPRLRLEDGPVAVREVQWPRLSPDGSEVIFSAVGYIWRQRLDGSPPQRVTTAGKDIYETMPSLSPDGESIVYVAFTRSGDALGPGRLMVATRDGATRQVGQSDVSCLYPAWSPDGAKLAYVRDDPEAPQFAWGDLSTGAARDVLPSSRRSTVIWDRLVHFSQDGDQLYCTTSICSPGNDGPAEAQAVAIGGGAPASLARVGPDAIGLIPSPDARHALVLGADEDLWLVDLGGVRDGETISFDDPRLVRITGTGARYAYWRDARTIIYGFCNRIYLFSLGSRQPELIHTIEMTYPRRQGAGVTAFVNGRVICMNGDRGAGDVIENATVVVRDRRIETVGANVAVPADANVIDCTGMTLMPALLDTHYHPNFGGAWGDAGPDLGSIEAISSGVTTALIPSQTPWNEGFLPIIDLQATGRAPGPRWFSSHGGVTFASNGAPSPRLLSSSEDALRITRHKKALGAPVMKEYLSRRSDHRRWFARAARQEGIGIIAHVAGIEQALSRAIDGYTGIEHVPFAAPLYQDAISILARTQCTWTPNFAATGYGCQTEVLAFAERLWVARPSARSAWEGQYSEEVFGRRLNSTRCGRVTEVARDLMRTGARLSTSTHGPPAHRIGLELWLMAQAGAATAECLRSATSYSTEKIGVADDLGSIEPGKIADFLVLRSNPLDDVINVLAQRYVVSDGLTFDVNTSEWAPANPG